MELILLKLVNLSEMNQLKQPCSIYQPVQNQLKIIIKNMLFKHLESVFTLLFYYVNSLHLIVISRKGSEFINEYRMAKK